MLFQLPFFLVFALIFVILYISLTTEIALIGILVFALAGGLGFGFILADIDLYKTIFKHQKARAELAQSNESDEQEADHQ